MTLADRQRLPPPSRAAAESSAIVLPRIRIEGVRGSNPLSSTLKLQAQLRSSVRY
jgi:hypothetical protein